jgi:RNA polymerase sigma factor, sigma-70 family
VSDDKTSSLYIAHRRDLVNYANGIVGDRSQAEDVVQEAFLRFRGVASARLLEEPLSYLYRIVRNLAFDGRRRLTLEERHFKAGFEGVAEEIAEDKPSPEAEAIARDELQRVLAAMDELPERTRIALEMHRFGGLKMREIAEHLGISVSMAQILVMKGIRHCQRSL